MKLFIGCSSCNDIPKDYLLDCNDYLNEILMSNDLVFGACSSGLMGLAYKIANKNGNKIIGICPEAYKDDLLDLNCSHTELTSSISDRTDKVIEQSDALIFLPGGIGTIYELFTAIESKRNHEFDKPIVIYNANHFFDKLLDFLSLIYNDNFTGNKVQGSYYLSDSAVDTLDYLSQYNKGKTYIKS